MFQDYTLYKAVSSTVKYSICSSVESKCSKSADTALTSSQWLVSPYTRILPASAKQMQHSALQQCSYCSSRPVQNLRPTAHNSIHYICKVGVYCMLEIAWIVKRLEKPVFQFTVLWFPLVFCITYQTVAQWESVFVLCLVVCVCVCVCVRACVMGHVAWIIDLIWFDLINRSV